MDKQAELSFQLGEASTITSTGFGLMSISLAIFYGTQTASEPVKTGGFWVGLLVLIAGFIVFAGGVFDYKRYKDEKAKLQMKS